jgi:hypothetical protein
MSDQRLYYKASPPSLGDHPDEETGIRSQARRMFEITGAIWVMSKSRSEGPQTTSNELGPTSRSMTCRSRRDPPETARALLRGFLSEAT